MSPFRPRSSENDIAKSYVRRMRPANSAAISLICFPHAGGAASAYAAFARGFDPAVDVVALQYPGRQDRRHEPFIETVTALADEAAAAITRWATGPYAIFGHSMGGIVAFETARRLERTEHGPVRLFVSGRRVLTSTRLSTSALTSDDDSLVAEIRRLSGTDQRILRDPEMLQMVLPALRNDYGAVATYEFTDRTPLRCPISALTGDADPECTTAEAAAWAAHTTGAFDVRVFAGSHFYLYAQPAIVAQHVDAILREHLSAAGPSVDGKGSPQKNVAPD